MKYERLTDRKIAEMLRNTVEKNWESDSLEAQCYIRLAELEDKIESGKLVEVPKGAVVLTPEERAEEMRLCNEERRQVLIEFADKLREKEFSAKSGSEWVAVVKSRDIDELVMESCREKCINLVEEVRREKCINAYHIAKIQAAAMRLFEALDEDYPDGRAVRANERAIQKWLDKITDDTDEQRQILDVIERENWNMEDTTFKPIFDELRALGYEIVIERAQK